MDEDHEDGLGEEGEGEVSAEPVEDPVNVLSVLGCNSPAAPTWGAFFSPFPM